MIGSGTNHTPDKSRQPKWQEEYDSHTMLSVEIIHQIFDSYWVHQTDEHQRRIGAIGISELLIQPFNPEDKATDLQIIAKNNVGFYDDDTEDEISRDVIIQKLFAQQSSYYGDEAFFALRRLRRTVVVARLLLTKDNTDLTTAS